MHLRVDDATTSVMGGWFMPTECMMRGYARMMREVVTRHGAPRAICPDKDSVFRTFKDGSPTQFVLMMRDLGVRMVFANSPQVKVRVERYNSTAQMRLHTDALRFGIGFCDEFNAWFNDFYASCPNSKFPYAPLDPADDFAALPPSLDPSAVFRARETRLSRGCVASCDGSVYMVADADSVAWHWRFPKA